MQSLVEGISDSSTQNSLEPCHRLSVMQHLHAIGPGTNKYHEVSWKAPHEHCNLDIHHLIRFLRILQLSIRFQGSWWPGHRTTALVGFCLTHGWSRLRHLHGLQTIVDLRRLKPRVSAPLTRPLRDGTRHELRKQVLSFKPYTFLAGCGRNCYNSI